MTKYRLGFSFASNRDEFPFSQAEWFLPSYFSPVLYVSREVQFSARKPIVKISQTKLSARTAGARVMCFKFLAGTLVSLTLFQGQSILKSLGV